MRLGIAAAHLMYQGSEGPDSCEGAIKDNPREGLFKEQGVESGISEELRKPRG